MTIAIIAMRKILWFVGVPSMALVGGVVGSLPVYVMGLVVPVFLVGPLALLTGALLATLSAGWLANLVSLGFDSGSNERSRSRLLAILGVSLLGAVVGLAVGASAVWLVNRFGGLGFTSVSAVYLPGAVVFSAVTTVATWRLRTPADTRASLGWMGAVLLALSGMWTVFLLVYGGMGSMLGLLAAVGMFIPLWVIFGVSCVFAAGGAVLLVWFRQPRRDTDEAGGGDARIPRRGDELAQDAGLTLLLTGFVPALIVVTLFVGCGLTYCGA